MVVLSIKILIGRSCLKEAYWGSGCYRKALRNWDWLSKKLVKSHCRNGLIPCLVVWFVSVFPGKEWRLLSWKMASRNLKTQQEPQGLEGSRYCRQCWIAGAWLGFCALKGRLRVSLKVPCVRYSKADLKILCDQLLLFLCLYNEQAKIKTGLNAVLLRILRVIFMRKIVLQGKSQCSVVGIGLV